ncbi:tetratricopeptide repeat protein [Flavobacterium sp. ZB4P13]|uniref:tetratricopeptide repeat protein n=1 Tax=Flavobacterium sp. ZB4P13 TaxID=3401728 RepID=UPI003AAB72AE
MNKILILIVIAFVFSCRKEPQKNVDAVIEKAKKPSYGCAPQTTDSDWYLTNNKAPIFKGLDVIDYPITTKSTEAQKYFNQGLALSYGFNHAEAARSFYYATKLDPECAMCFWGFAYVLGPNYNAGMEPDNYERAYKAVQKAMKLLDKASKKERALIKALAKRYTEKHLEDRSSLDIAYAAAMKKVNNTFPEDANINALYAESIMDLHPWDLYEKDGTPKKWTMEIVSLLEKILKKNPKHIGANHFYIHAVEASNTPERGNNAAKVFDDGLVPGSGHLVHMPSHIYIRTGEYHKGTLTNINAIKVDSTYVTMCHAQGAYPLGYYPHNYHFMAGTATLEGNSKWAMIAANQVSKHAHPKIMTEPGWGTLQHYYVIPYYVAVKFGKWDDIFKMKLVTDTLKYPVAVRHYARGMAYLGKKDLKKAKQELFQLEEIAKDKKLERITIWELNSVYTLIQIAKLVLKAEIVASEKNYAQSIALLKEAVAIEDSLNYNEPPDWFFSVRHHLGAVQIEAGKYQDAVKTYEADLKGLPKNGWAHHGLQLAYEKMNNKRKAKEIKKRIEKSWANADTKITTSRIK